MSDKLNIGNEMRELDAKNRDFYDELTPEERKKFSNYLMIRWASCVEGSRDLQEFYLISTNERLNKHFFNISAAKHKKLQWLLATTVSPGLGTQRHNWIAPKKKDATLTGKRKQLAEIYPHLKDDEINVLAGITSQKEINEYLKKFGEGS